WSPGAVSQGELSGELSSEQQVRQAMRLSTGKTTVVPQTTVQATEQANKLMVLDAGSTLEDLVRGLNELKVTPRDIIAILQALKQAGALHAELEII
ncbi:MAG: flagellar basal body P-ring protein FlgI, partial [Armatimonadetes bacterium]|nr:flagellar basal body P-ring protein FlgI [Armatimonadota bacterium]